jgi:hypothetical protein
MKTSPITTGTTSSLPIFVYGTLMNPSVVEILLGRPLWATEEVSSKHLPKVKPAILKGYSRHPVNDHVFPATIPAAATTTTTGNSQQVQGLLLPSTLSPVELAIFDYFESEEYERKTVQVEVISKNNDDDPLAAAAAVEDAQVYIWRNDLLSQLDLTKGWSYDSFVATHLDWYLEHTVRPCCEELVRLGMTTTEEKEEL